MKFAHPLHTFLPPLALALGLAALLSPLPALAAEAPVYAFLSLIGDKLGVVVNESSTGSHLDRNRREEPVAINTDVFATQKRH
jgi:hypothetical protein